MRKKVILSQQKAEDDFFNPSSGFGYFLDG